MSTATGPYGGSTQAPLSATLTSGGNGVSGKTISFTLNGTSVGTAITNGSGVAALLSVSSLAGINAGDYPAGVVATYEGQTSANLLKVDARAATVTAERQVEDLRRRQPDADGDGDGDGQRRHAQLLAGDDGAEVLERR